MPFIAAPLIPILDDRPIQGEGGVDARIGLPRRLEAGQPEKLFYIVSIAVEREMFIWIVMLIR